MSARLLRLAPLLVLVPGCQVGSGDPPDGSPTPLDGGTVIRCETNTDADGDGIFDEFETNDDFDGDGIPNYMDTDSDGDGYSDSDEHGTDNGCSAIDTDGDGHLDFLDLDADGDGLSDEEERTTYFTDPLNDDTDGDGFTDLAEVATGRDPADPSSRVPDEAFYVVLPYLDDAVERELVFGTQVRKADVFFMVDSTGSMGGEISNLVSGLDTIVAEMRASLTDVGVGFGQFAGFGGAGETCVLGICTPDDGPDGDVPFELVQTITTDDTVMRSAVTMLEARTMSGAGTASSAEAIYQAATGEGILPWVDMQRCPAYPDEESSRYGYPCFRPGALPVMVVLTDTGSRNGPGSSTTDYDPSLYSPPGTRGPHTYEETLSAVMGIGGRVIGIISGMESGDPDGQFDTWARETGTVDAGGSPIRFNISENGSGLDGRVVDAIRLLAEETPQDISADVIDGEDRPSEIGPVDAGDFVKAITPVSIYTGGVSHDCPDATLCDDTRFFDVTPGATVTFNVRFRNDFQEPRSFAQVFLAEIVVLGNGVAELDSREVIIVVPAGSVPILI